MKFKGRRVSTQRLLTNYSITGPDQVAGGYVDEQDILAFSGPRWLRVKRGFSLVLRWQGYQSLQMNL